MQPENELDLVLSRVVEVPRSLVWRAWTEPEHLKRWFTPKPWITVDARIDLRPGGVFGTVMRGPNGETHAGDGCILDVVPERRLVWTDTLLPGFRPAKEPFFTAIIELADAPGGTGTQYTATALHRDSDARKRHEDMGFHNGWSTALDQLVEHAREMR